MRIVSDSAKSIALSEEIKTIGREYGSSSTAIKFVIETELRSDLVRLDFVSAEGIADGVA